MRRPGCIFLALVGLGLIFFQATAAPPRILTLFFTGFIAGNFEPCG
ncbi:MAG: hypothetical protein HY645_01805 [Acidobacteria bacterium]|nr:hypothetical protein [Acidobacteriota bacterium]